VTDRQSPSVAVKTGSIANLQKFLAPGARTAICEITAVSDEPAS
jgi:hypothetical protein